MIMKTIERIKKAFKSSKKGQGMVEYGLIIALIAIIVMVAIGLLGGQLTTMFNSVTDALKPKT